MNERVTALKNQVFRASKEAERKNDLVHHLLDPLKVSCAFAMWAWTGARHHIHPSSPVPPAPSRP